MKKTQAHY